MLGKTVILIVFVFPCIQSFGPNVCRVPSNNSPLLPILSFYGFIPPSSAYLFNSILCCGHMLMFNKKTGTRVVEVTLLIISHLIEVTNLAVK